MMIKIVRGNSTGKTKELLAEAAKLNNSTIVCKNPFHMKDKAAAYGIFNLKFIQYKEFFFQAFASSDQVFFIDDVDSMLDEVGNINGYTLTVD